MRELGLTLIYRCFIMLRFVAWRVLRPRAIGVRVVVRRGDEFLLVHHRGGAAPWGLPGGAIDRGEAPADAARREVLEESGCPVTITGLHGVFHYLAHGLSDYIIDSTARRLNITNQKVTQLAAKGAGAGGGKAKK